jgi:excinuclease ABC subunit B
MYADKLTDSMKHLIETTRDRRAKQLAYNEQHGITPTSIYKTREEIMGITSVADAMQGKEEAIRDSLKKYETDQESGELLEMMRKDMLHAAETLDFEKAAMIRDEIKKLEREIKR